MKRMIICAALILSLVLFFACGKKETPQEKAQKELAKNMAELGKAMGGSSSGGKNPWGDFQKSTEAIKQQSETIQGGKIEVAGRETMVSVMPTVSGWTSSEPNYSRTSAGNIEVSSISADYSQGQGEGVSVKIEDTGTASSMLAPVKMVLQMNLSHEDDNGYQKISSVNNIPVIEEFDKGSNRARLNFILKERFLVHLETQNQGGMNLLKEFASKMDMSKLMK